MGNGHPKMVLSERLDKKGFRGFGAGFKIQVLIGPKY
jgi:hypothetical protein